MSPFHVNYQSRLADVTAALEVARAENRNDDVRGLELAVLVLDQHVGELRRGRELALA